MREAPQEHPKEAGPPPHNVEHPPNEPHILAVLRSGPGYIVTTDVDGLLDIARIRVTRDFTTQECSIYRIEPCPAAD
jgi:hypothetical protein